MSSPLTSWESFYVIVGSSAAALTGLQFVVIAVIAGSSMRRNMSAISAFGTPTVVHLCAVLLISAILSAPWDGLGNPRLLLLASGLGGLAYTTIVTLRARRQTAYKPVFEDWLWHTALPFVAYFGLFIASATLVGYDTESLFAIGAMALLLIFVGIHNAWDTATYIALEASGPESKSPK